MAMPVCKPFSGTSETAVRLMLRTPYFMVVYYAMTIYEGDFTIRGRPLTLATNGVSLWINPKFWKQLNREQRMTAVAHELGHRMLLHATRRGDRDPYIWNIAGDHVINLMLVESKFTPLAGLTIDGKPWSWFCDPQFTGMTTEQVYDVLMEEYQNQPKPQPGQGGEGSGGTDGEGEPTQQQKDLGDAGDLVDFGATPTGDKDETPGAQQTKEAYESTVRKELKEAEMTGRQAGKLPNWLKRTIENADHVRTNWFDVLEQYIRALHKAEYDWHRWQRREFVKSGVLAPDIFKPALGRVLMYVDCSGSCWSALAKFNKHIRDIWEQVAPEAVDLRYFQTEVNHEYDQTFERGEGDVEIHRLGGGGTAISWLAEEIENEAEQYDLVLVLTDMEVGAFGREVDGVPVVWLSVSSIDHAPFGEVVLIN